MRYRGALLAATACVLSGCGGIRTAAPLTPFAQPANELERRLPSHAIIGFSVDTPKRAATAARQGITATILYGGSPAPGSHLQRALQAHGIAVVDAGISGILFLWECHRTHTVAPPPKSYSYNPYCRTDEDPKVKSEAIALRYVDKILRRDAKRDYVVGHWVLDDWAWWDPGSGRGLLQQIHAAIAEKNSGLPAICGFGAGLTKPDKVGWDPGTAANYSNGGCDIVGWYNYSPFGRRHPSRGKDLDWKMTALLPAMAHSLEKRGWKLADTPLYGIAQAWAGSYDKHYYQPGLTRREMLEQAKAFCSFGASYLGWYAWDDSGDNRQTQTPNNSATIAAGIAAGISACKTIWG
jgi:hypothetical protein